MGGKRERLITRSLPWLARDARRFLAPPSMLTFSSAATSWTSFEGGWMSRTMGEIGEVIQAERIGLRQKERARVSGSAAEKRKSVRPSFQHILSAAQIFTGSHFPSRARRLVRNTSQTPDRCADLGHRWSEKRGRDDPILEALYLRGMGRLCFPFSHGPLDSGHKEGREEERE